MESNSPFPGLIFTSAHMSEQRVSCNLSISRFIGQKVLFDLYCQVLQIFLNLTVAYPTIYQELVTSCQMKSYSLKRVFYKFKKKPKFAPSEIGLDSITSSLIVFSPYLKHGATEMDKLSRCRKSYDTNRGMSK